MGALMDPWLVPCPVVSSGVGFGLILGKEQGGGRFVMRLDGEWGGVGGHECQHSFAQVEQEAVLLHLVGEDAVPVSVEVYGVVEEGNHLEVGLLHRVSLGLLSQMG